MAAASSSCDSELVALSDFNKLDDATKSLFLSDDGDSAGTAAMSWPAAEAISSTLTSEAALRTLCETHGVPKEYKPICAAHLGNWAACTPPPPGTNAVCVYAAALEAGLRFPLHGFYVRVLRHFGIAPSQLSPNAWSYLAAFVLRCEDAGVEPLVSAFRHFFAICGQKGGWYHFRPYTDAGRRLFAAGDLPGWAGWKSKFFFLQAPATDWKPPRWGKPRKEAASKVKHTDNTVNELKDMGSVEIRRFLASRNMPAGDLPEAPLLTPVKAEGSRAAAAGDGARNKRKSPPAPSSCPAPARLAAFISTPPRLAGSHSGRRTEPTLLGSFAAMPAAPAPPGPGLAEFTSPQRCSAATTPSLAGLHSGRRTEPMAAPAPAGIFAVSPQLVPGFPDAAGSEREPPHQLRCGEAMVANLKKQLAAAHRNEAKHAAERDDLMARLQAAAYHNQHLKEQLKAELERELLRHLCEVKQLKAENARLKSQHARLKEEHADENAQLKKEYAAVNAQLKKELAAEAAQMNEELAAETAQMKKEFAAKAAQMKKEGYDMGVMHMRQRALELRPDLLLELGNWNDLGCSLMKVENK